MNKLVRRILFPAATLGGLVAANQGKFGKAEVEIYGGYAEVEVQRDGPFRQVCAHYPPLPPSQYNMRILAIFGDPPPPDRTWHYLRPVHVTWIDSTGQDRSKEVTYH